MADRHGPLRASMFKVELDGVQVKGFKNIDLPEQKTQQVEYREGNDPDFNRRLWGRTQYEDLVLERGVKKGDTKLYDWRKKVNQGNLKEARKNIAVVLLDEMKQPQIRYEFTKAWPKVYEAPTLDAGDQGGAGNVATETVVVAYDEMKRTK